MSISHNAFYLQNTVPVNMEDSKQNTMIPTLNGSPTFLYNSPRMIIMSFFHVEEFLKVIKYMMCVTILLFLCWSFMHSFNKQ